MSINMYKLRVRNAKDGAIYLLFGVAVGYLIGLLFTFDAGTDISRHIHLLEHEVPTQNPKSFDLRCVVIIHKAIHKPEKVISAIHDGYAKLCQQTIYFTNNRKVYDVFKNDHTMHFVASTLNHFYWSFYQNVMEVLSKVPAQWTFIGDDQTYLIVPNLQKALQAFDSESPVILGKVQDTSNFFSWIFPFSGFKKVSIRGGVVLSNTAIDKLLACKSFFFARASDYALYECSEHFGIQVADPFDEDALRLFNDLGPKEIITPDVNYFGSRATKTGKCSDHAISFGRLSEKDMRVLQYGMTLNVFGRGGILEQESNKTSA